MGLANDFHFFEKIEKFNKVLPIQELEQIRDNREEYISELIKAITYVIAEKDRLIAIESDYFLHIFAIYLLAEFKQKDAFPCMMDFLELSQEEFKYLSHGMLDDKYLPRILVSTYNGNFTLLSNVIENKEVSEYVRGSALEACKLLVNEGIIQKKDFELYLEGLIKQKLEAGPFDDPNAYFFIALIIVIMKLNLHGLRKIVYQLYFNGYIDQYFVGDYQEFIDEVFSEQYIDEAFIEDAIYELFSSKAFRNSKEYKKKPKSKNNRVGRNGRSIWSDDILEGYPPLDANGELKGLREFYDDEAIAVDVEMYKAISKDKSLNNAFGMFTSFFSEDESKTFTKEIELLEQYDFAYELFVKKAEKENISVLELYNDKFMIHYEIEEFLGEYLSHINKMYQKYDDWLEKDHLIAVIEEVLNNYTLNNDYDEVLRAKLKQLYQNEDYDDIEDYDYDDNEDNVE